MSPERARNRRNRKHSQEISLDESLSAEIATLRDLMRQMAESYAEQTSLPDRLRILSVLGQSSTQLAQVLKVQSELGSSSALVDAIRKAAEKVRQQLEGGTQAGEQNQTL